MDLAGANSSESKRLRTTCACHIRRGCHRKYFFLTHIDSAELRVPFRVFPQAIERAYIIGSWSGKQTLNVARPRPALMPTMDKVLLSLALT
jgi:hypothetical protein